MLKYVNRSKQYNSNHCGLEFLSLKISHTNTIDVVDGSIDSTGEAYTGPGLDFVSNIGFEEWHGSRRPRTVVVHQQPAALYATGLTSHDLEVGGTHAL